VSMAGRELGDRTIGFAELGMYILEAGQPDDQLARQQGPQARLCEGR
jgi:hypothetical protein